MVLIVVRLLIICVRDNTLIGEGEGARVFRSFFPTFKIRSLILLEIILQIVGFQLLKPLCKNTLLKI